MRENLKLGIILGLITSIAGLFLGLSNSFTKDAIAENSKLAKEDLAIIMPLATYVDETDEALEGNILEILEGKNNSESAGYLFKVTSKGFHGAINLMIGISKEGTLTGVKIISHSETPGLGAKIEDENFTSKFKDRTTDKKISITKAAPVNEGEVEGVSGATISSKAVATAVNEAINYFRIHMQGAVPIEDGTDATSGATGVDATSGATE